MRRLRQHVRAGEAEIGNARKDRKQEERRTEDGDQVQREKRCNDEQRQHPIPQDRTEQRRKRPPEQQRGRRVEEHEDGQPHGRLWHTEQRARRRFHKKALERQHQQRECHQGEPHRKNDGKQPASVEFEVGERTHVERVRNQGPPIAGAAVESQGEHAQKQHPKREAAVARHVQPRRRRLAEPVRAEEVEIEACAQTDSHRREDPSSHAAPRGTQLLDHERHDVGNGHLRSTLENQCAGQIPCPPSLCREREPRY